MRSRAAGWVLVLACVGAWAGPAHGTCSDTTIATEGVRRIALLVGVRSYLDLRQTPLSGPKNDVEDVRHMLELYGFPAQNVCVLLDGEATVAAVQREAVRLARRARGPTDQVVFFYSGHGGRVADDDGDEVDGIDETLFLHDSMTTGGGGPIGQLRDDELREAFAAVRQKTKNVTAAFDSCFSGTVTRGSGVGRDRVKVATLDVVPRASAGTGREDAGWLVTPPGMLVLSAASPDTNAHEPADGDATRSYFTHALVEALSRALQVPTTWSQVNRMISEELAMRVAYQRPTFEGLRPGLVFGRAEAPRPQDWEVVSVDSAGGTVALAGLPLPGWQVDTSADIHAPGADPTDRARAKAAVRVSALDGVFGASARIVGPVRAALRPGDIAVMTEASGRIEPLRYAFAQAGPGKLAAAQVAKIEAAIRADPETAATARRVEGGADVVLKASPGGELELWGSEGIFRVRIATAEEAAARLRSAIRQRVLASLASNNLDDLRDGEGLRVEIVPSTTDLKSCARPAWPLACPGEAQEIPVCSNFQVDVVNTSRRPLYVGGVILSNDLGLVGLQADDPLPVRGRLTLSHRRAVTPLDLDETVLVFGSVKRPPVRWQDIASDQRERGPISSLARKLPWAVPRTRSEPVDEDDGPSWTVARRTFRVVSNPRPGLGAACGQGAHDPVVVRPFEARPFAGVSANRDRLLAAAVAVEQAAQAAGAGDAAAQLRRGADGARAIGLLFARAGLAYGAGDAGVPLADMARDDSPMRAAFARCDARAPAAGDVWVYLGKTRGGQTARRALVLADPVQQLGWGIHAWDAGTAAEQAALGDHGISFQAIRALDGWASAGIVSMSRAACWRHQSWVDALARSPSVEVAGAACDACR